MNGNFFISKDTSLLCPPKVLEGFFFKRNFYVGFQAKLWRILLCLLHSIFDNFCKYVLIFMKFLSLNKQSLQIGKLSYQWPLGRDHKLNEKWSYVSGTVFHIPLVPLYSFRHYVSTGTDPASQLSVRWVLPSFLPSSFSCQICYF